MRPSSLRRSAGGRVRRQLNRTRDVAASGLAVVRLWRSCGRHARYKVAWATVLGLEHWLLR
jgi:hypothetical protein